MTVIAWDGTTLAADKQATAIGYGSTVTKIYRVPQGIVGFIGSGPHAMAIRDWFRAGAIDGDFPVETDDDKSAHAILVTHEGEVRSYASCRYHVSEDAFVAAGAGRDYALAAMFLGKTAREAVEVACALDIFCGNGIDTLTLEQP